MARAVKFLVVTMVPVLITMVIFIQWRYGQMTINSNRKKASVKATQLEVPARAIQPRRVVAHPSEIK